MITRQIHASFFKQVLYTTITTIRGSEDGVFINESSLKILRWRSKAKEFGTTLFQASWWKLDTRHFQRLLCRISFLNICMFVSQKWFPIFESLEFSVLGDLLDKIFYRLGLLKLLKHCDSHINGILNIVRFIHINCRFVRQWNLSSWLLWLIERFVGDALNVDHSLTALRKEIPWKGFAWHSFFWSAKPLSLEFFSGWWLVSNILKLLVAGAFINVTLAPLAFWLSLLPSICSMLQQEKGGCHLDLSWNLCIVQFAVRNGSCSGCRTWVELNAWGK